MRKLFIGLAMLLFTITTLFSQARNVDGLWQGTVELDNSQKITLTLFILNNNVFPLTVVDGELDINRNIDVVMSKAYGEHFNLMWINTGGIWTETQFFSLTKGRGDVLHVYMMRHVSNESSDFDGNTRWGYTGTGILRKL